MNSLATLDSKLERLRPWIIRAGESLMTFYLPSEGQFVRDTLPRAEAGKGSRTSTNRAFFALAEYLRFLREESFPKSSESKVQEVIAGVCKSYLEKMQDDAAYVRRSSDNGINMFTDGHLLLSISLIPVLGDAGVSTGIDAGALDKVKNSAKQIAEEGSARLKQWRGGKIDVADEVHDFITLHFIRGLDSIGHPLPEGAAEEIGGRVREDVLRQLGSHFAGVSSRFDPAELIFSVALLNRFPVADARRLADRAIRSIIESQTESGGWPTSRMVSYGVQNLLHVTSFEVALTLTCLFLQSILQREEEDLCDIVLDALDRSFSLVQGTFTIAGSRQGWANDHARWTGHVESWVTAIVLTFLLRLREVFLELRQAYILKHYRSSLEDYRGTPFVWPDLDSLFGMRYRVNKDALSGISDPTEEGVLSGRVWGRFLEPISKSWVHRPQYASLVLSGPPGSRKTSLARSVARALHWPLITLSPPHFLAQGLEGFEATAENIFQDLLRLRRAVVLFDECEDFFKLRRTDQRAESRTLGAFITSGMLPRLQALRDNRWVVFILATNSALDDLDDAVLRQGRFDFGYKLDYPTIEAQKRYVSKKLGLQHGAPLIDTLGQFDQAHGRDKEAPKVSFSVLDRLVEIVQAQEHIHGDELLAILADLANRKGPEALVSEE